MHSFRFHLLTLAAATVLSAASASAAGNLLVNGSFESGPAVPGLFVDLPTGSTAITGWTVGGFHVDYCKFTTWNPSDGSFSVDLDGSTSAPYNGSLFQSFATTPGQPYVVTFDLSGNPYALPLVKEVEVSAGNKVQVYAHDIGSVAPPPVPGSITYHQETFRFTAVSTTSTLTFRSLTPSSGSPTGWGAVIDRVVAEVDTSLWIDQGFALAGVAGLPQLVGTGPLTAGSPGSIVLSNAAPSAPALLFIALAAHPTPFKCGTLLPAPWISTFALTTSAAGGIPLGWAAWPAGLSGLSLHFQYAVKDNAALCGASLSNAVRGNVP